MLQQRQRRTTTTTSPSVTSTTAATTSPQRTNLLFDNNNNVVNSNSSNHIHNHLDNKKDDSLMDDDSKYNANHNNNNRPLDYSLSNNNNNTMFSASPPPQKWPILFGATMVVMAWLLIIGDNVLFFASTPSSSNSSPSSSESITTITTTTSRIKPIAAEGVRSEQQQQPQQNPNTNPIVNKNTKKKNKKTKFDAVGDHDQNNDEDDFSKAFGPDGVEYHMIFSTGCSTFQDWQSFVFFYHAWKSGQPGHLTRIASGCSEESARELQLIHKEQIDIMSPGRFHVHLAPDYTYIKPNVEYKYFNKPFGVKHWMQHVLGYPKDKSHDDAIVILLDPDQIVLRPFFKDFTNSTELWNPINVGKYKVEHGTPFAQAYGFGSQWRTKTNMSYITPHQSSPVDTVSKRDAELFYAAGPPYMATARDMYAIVDKWTEFVVRIHDLYPHLLAEMFGYCLAAAHLQLPHQMAWSFMVSDTTGGDQGEGWKLIDRYSNQQVCGNQIPQDQLPHVIHYCQRYNLGKWYFAKHRLPTDFISCPASLIREPPLDVAVQFNFGVRPWQEVEIWRFPHVAKRHGFMLCTLIQAMNDAAIYYKTHNCINHTDADNNNLFSASSMIKSNVSRIANYEKNFTFFPNETMVVEQKWYDMATAAFQQKPMLTNRL